MGVKSAAATISPKQLAQIASDNAVAQITLTNRLKLLDETIRTVDHKLASDKGLSAYPLAKRRLENIKAAAMEEQATVRQKLDLRKRLGAAAASGDAAGAMQVQAELSALKTDKSVRSGAKQATDSPTVRCQNGISSTCCDTAIATVNYLKTSRGPSSPLSPDDPCYGTSLAEWDGWDEMIAHGCATAEERDIITAMSCNEGSFESVQSYDGMVLTVGAMQKTVNIEGKGEFTEQLAAFKEKSPTDYKRLFADHGWTVEDKKTHYLDARGISRTGANLQAYLRSASPADQIRALAPLRTAGRDPVFRKQQICDFIARLHEATDREIEMGGKNYRAGDFITSTRGKAMLLDSSVNAGLNERTFKATVKWFYTTHPGAGKNPAAWANEERARNEAAIFDRYASTRKVAAPAKETRTKRNAALSTLSPNPNPNGLASKRPNRTCPDCGGKDNSWIH